MDAEFWVFAVLFVIFILAAYGCHENGNRR